MARPMTATPVISFGDANAKLTQKMASTTTKA